MKTLNPTALLLCLCCALAATAQARPAPWYKWRSKIDGFVTCSQTPLGPGWIKDSGPFRDSRCEKPILAK